METKWAFALYDFEAVQSGDLAFRGGDLLQTFRDPSSTGGWIGAFNPRTGLQGTVPSNYITYEHGYSAALDAFNQTDRSGANELLRSQNYLSQFNYVIRPSHDGDSMALSVLPREGCSRHYRIFFKSDDGNCYLYGSHVFKTLEDLVVNYMENEIEPGCVLQAYKPFRDTLPV